MLSRSRSGTYQILIPIVLASGFAGLGYEMVWTRVLTVSLGSDMMAVLGAVAGFFAGLGVGAFILDRPIRHARSPQVAFALLESVIGAWGLISVWMLPAAGRALPPLLGTHPAPAVLWAVSFAFPAVALLPATTAMGGTLTALERMASQMRGHAGLSAGIYGANTAGAVTGTLVSAFVLFPRLGLSGTLIFLAGLNGTCAIGALMLGPAASPAEAAPASHSLPGTRLSMTLFASGMFGILVEVLIIRLAAQSLQNTIYTFAGLLAAYLLGTSLGGLAWQRFAGRPWFLGGAFDRDSKMAALLGSTALACLATAALTPMVGPFGARFPESGIVGELAVATALFLVPAMAMGALFGHLAQRVRDQRGSVGWAVGINSVGAALAPLVAAQILIPSLGAWRALVAVASGYLFLLPLQRKALAWAVLPAALILVMLVRPAPPMIGVPSGGRVVALREGPMATASVVEDGGGVRYLEINGHFRMGGTSSMRSDYRQALLPLLLHPAPHRALFLGVGTGATLVGGAQLPGVTVQGVELSREVVDLLPWFANPQSRVPPPPVTVADARRYVAADSGQYDVIVADLFHPALDGSGALYTTEHFQAVKRRLARGGLFCQWLPLYQLDAASLKTIMRGFLDAYPGGSAWLNHYSVRTPMLALVGPRDPVALDVETLAARLSNDAVNAVTKPLGIDAPVDLLGQYVGGPRALAEFAGIGPRNTDDFPFVALDAGRNVRALRAPPGDLLIALIGGLQPNPEELLTGTSLQSLRARLSAYWRARDAFLTAGARLNGDPRGLELVDAASPGLLAAVRLSAEFDPAYKPLIGMAQALLGSDHEAGVRLLREISDAAPSRGEARDILAGEFARSQGVN